MHISSLSECKKTQKNYKEIHSNIKILIVGLHTLQTHQFSGFFFMLEWFRDHCSDSYILHPVKQPTPITEVTRSKAWTVFARSNTGIVGSNPTRGMDVCVRLFCVCVVLCVGSGLATGWSPVQGVLQTVYRTKRVKKRPRSKGCRTIEREREREREREKSLQYCNAKCTYYLKCTTNFTLECGLIIWKVGSFGK
jgi:hypothetical protein